jgi:hypothetical protein
VTLPLAWRLNPHRRYQLVVNGSTPTGVADLIRNLLDGAGNGKPGSNYVAVLRGFGRNEPGRSFRMLIRDQLGGKPMSSRRVSLRTSSRVSHQTHPTPAQLTRSRSIPCERNGLRCPTARSHRAGCDEARETRRVRQVREDAPMPPP